MRKNYDRFLLAIICSGMLFTFIGCKDDEESNPQDKDDDMTEMPMTPTEDTQAPFMTGVLYYFNEIRETKDANSLEDNLVRRFLTKQKWNGEALQKGDCLLANEEDVPASFQDIVRKEALSASFKNGALFVIDGGTAEHYQALCESIGAFNFYKTEGEAEVDSAKTTVQQGSDLWVLSGNLPGCHILASVLEINDDKGNCINDFSQGEKVSMLLQSYVENCNATRSLTATRSGESDLLSIANAYKVQHITSKTIAQKDYFDTEKAGHDRTSSFQNEYVIYPMYSENDKRYYYYVHQELIAPFAPYYIGVYNVFVEHIIKKACEYYGSEVRTTLTPKIPGVIIHENSPATTQGAVSYTSGVSFSLSGTVGYSSTMGVTGSVTAGMSVSNSMSYTAQDVNVSNLCMVGGSPEMKWSFKLREAEHSFKLTNTAMDKLTPPSLAGQTTFTAGTDYIISAPTAGGTFESVLYIQWKATAGGAGNEDWSKSSGQTSRLKINFPVLNM